MFASWNFGTNESECYCERDESPPLIAILPSPIFALRVRHFAEVLFSCRCLSIFFFSSSIYFLALVRTLEEPWSLPSVLCRPCTCSVLPCSNKTSLPNYRTFVASYSVRYAFTTMQTFSLERLLSVSRVFEAGWRTNSVTAVRNLAHFFFIHSSDIVLVSSEAFVQSLRHLIFTDAVVYSG